MTYDPVTDSLEHRGVPFHPSHSIWENWDFPDPHSPGWFCENCLTYQCALCVMEPDDDLALPCEEDEEKT